MLHQKLDLLALFGSFHQKKAPDGLPCSSRSRHKKMVDVSVQRAKMKIVSGLCFICLFCFASLTSCDAAHETSRVKTIVIDVTGDNYNWYFRYPGEDGKLGNGDDQYSEQNLFLPDHSNVKLRLHSKDYIYSFSLPDLDISEVAVPGLDFEINFSTGAEKTLSLLGDQFCGYAHKQLIGEVSIRNQDNGFYGWSSSAPYQYR